jgi:hypothetical protein
MSQGSNLLLKASLARNQQRVGRLNCEQLLTQDERATMNSRQLIVLHSMGESLSTADRAKFSGRELIVFAGMGNELTADERRRLKPSQLMIYRTMSMRRLTT